MRNRLPNGLGGRRHWLDMLGGGNGKVNRLPLPPSRFNTTVSQPRAHHAAIVHVHRGVDCVPGTRFRVRLRVRLS